MPQLTQNGQTFTYGEQSFGTNRGIVMYRNGVKDDRHTYKFVPNPHDDRWYNKNQAKFYLYAAEAIATHLHTHANAWPPNNAAVSVNGVSYRLELQ